MFKCSVFNIFIKLVNKSEATSRKNKREKQVVKLKLKDNFEVMSLNKRICGLRQGMTRHAYQILTQENIDHNKQGIFKRLAFSLGIGRNVRGSNIRTQLNEENKFMG